LIHLILVLVDSSPISEQALIEAINIGRIYRSKITCVHPIPRHDELLLKVGHDIIKRAEEIVRSTGLEFEWRIVEDQPGPAMVKVASRLKADLAVVGSLGEQGIARHLLPSIAEHVVKNAPCDVLVVKRDRPVF